MDPEDNAPAPDEVDVNPIASPDETANDESPSNTDADSGSQTQSDTPSTSQDCSQEQTTTSQDGTTTNAGPDEDVTASVDSGACDDINVSADNGPDDKVTASADAGADDEAIISVDAGVIDEGTVCADAGQEDDSPPTQNPEDEAQSVAEPMEEDAITKDGEEATNEEENTVSNEAGAADEAPAEEMDMSDSPSKADQSTDTANLDETLNQSTEQDEIQRTEEVDMANVAEQSVRESGDDPFDSLRQNTSGVSDKDNEMNNTAADESTINDDEDVPDNHDESMVDETSKSGIEEPLVEDDLEHGMGVDEELSLLPDTEREITETDKERALQGETETQADDEVAPAEENSAENDNQNHNQKTDHVNDSIGDSDGVDSIAPKEGEIIELQGDRSEAKCIQCNESRACQFTLLHGTQTSYLCSSECVTTFRVANDNYSLTAKRVTITLIVDAEKPCRVCGDTKACKFRLRGADNAFEYVCEDACLTKLQEDHPDTYSVRRKRYDVDEMAETTELFTCLQCAQKKNCRFSFQQDTEVLHVCQDDCLNLLMKEQPDRFRFKRRSVRVRDLPKRAGHGSATIEDPAAQAAESSKANKMLARTDAEAEAARLDREASFVRRCQQCLSVVEPNERTLIWETMDFCNESCLGRYQHQVGSECTTCHGAVQMTSLGKYCVRFGFEVRQFCRSTCLDEFKKGLKVCSYCQTDISKSDRGFLASIGGQFKDFCKPQCMKKYDEMCNPKKKVVNGACSVCMNLDPIRVEVTVNGKKHSFCSNPCFSAFQFVNNISADKCEMCQKYFERQSAHAYTIYPPGSTPLMYCSKVCMNIYIITQRKIVPCQWCKVKKYNFDMIQKHSNGKTSFMLCSINCLTLCEVSVNAISMKKQPCDKCKSMTTPQYHITMSDATIRSFCTYQCVMLFQSQYSKPPLTMEAKTVPAAGNTPIPTGLPKRIKTSAPNFTANKTVAANTNINLAGSSSNATPTNNKPTRGKIKPPPKAPRNNAPVNKVPVISNVTSLASGISTRRMTMQPVVELETIPVNVLRTYAKKPVANEVPEVAPPQPSAAAVAKVQTKTHIVTIPPIPKHVANKSIMCKPAVKNVDTQCRPKTATIGCQTDDKLERTIFIPIPVPIYVPQPMHMYSLPTPVPVPFPLPIPVPIFIPTTRNSANGIMKEIKKIQDKMPTDPFEAELLMMAEMVAGDKKKNDSDSGSEDEPEEDFGSEAINDGAALGEDMLQMALKMAQEYEAPPAVDLESAMTTNTITPGAQPPIYRGDIAQHHLMTLQQQQVQSTPPPTTQRGRKRASPGGASNRNPRSPAGQPNKRARQVEIETPTPQPEPPREPAEKADANMCLKFTFGVNAWKQWVMTKNADLEKSSFRRKTFKSDLLQLTADELNYSLCLFVKEVRKPNGSEYAPDTIYYLVLGIQQYLYENGRIDNIFTDPYYEKFTDCLDEVAKKFSVLYNDSQYIVTRVEEEHLWECKQLGAHSPHVLLSTLMFFNTKHFNLTTVDEHMQLSFSHIMKHWKRNPNQVSAGKPNSRNVLLRFYPPQTALEGNSRKKKVYEQQENEENPLRCPVKLYEFYLSKCPESVKTRNDVFYLQPERSCVPDSPVWYSTQPLPKDSLCKMLRRVKMVKEINIALLTS